MKTAYPDLQEEQTDINLTPMLNVVFNLLIFSVIPLPDDVESIVVSIDADNGFHVNGRVLAASSLAPYVVRMRAEFPDAGFGVLVSPDAYVEATMIAIDAGRRAGFERIPVTEYQ